MLCRLLLLLLTVLTVIVWGDFCVLAVIVGSTANAFVGWVYTTYIRLPATQHSILSTLVASCYSCIRVCGYVKQPLLPEATAVHFSSLKYLYTGAAAAVLPAAAGQA